MCVMSKWFVVFFLFDSSLGQHLVVAVAFFSFVRSFFVRIENRTLVARLRNVCCVLCYVICLCADQCIRSSLNEYQSVDLVLVVVFVLLLSSLSLPLLSSFRLFYFNLVNSGAEF